MTTPIKTTAINNEVKAQLDLTNMVRKEDACVASDPNWPKAITQNSYLQKVLANKNPLKIIEAGENFWLILVGMGRREPTELGYIVTHLDPYAELVEKSRRSGVVDTRDPLFIRAAKIERNIYLLTHPAEMLRGLHRN